MNRDGSVRLGPYTFTRCVYDAGTDVLYLSVGQPREAITWESPEGHLFRLDVDTGDVVGLTLLNVRALFEADDFRISIPYKRSRLSSRPSARRVQVRSGPIAACL